MEYARGIAGRGRFWKHAVLISLLIAAPALFAQEVSEIPEESGSYTYRTEAGFSIHQIISFPAVPNVLRYEIEIERFGEVGTEALQTLETPENKFEVSLRAGDYRYRVTAYNKMGLLEGRSGWQNFEVRPALQPEAETFRPFYGLFYYMAVTDGSVTVAGEDFSAESEFALVRHKSEADWTGKVLEEEKDVILPSSVDVNGNNAELHFTRGSLRTGNFDIFIRNPGGLWTLLGVIRVGHKSRVEWTFSIAYAPMLALFDLENATTGYSYPGPYGQQWERTERLDRFNSLGYVIRLGFIPVKTKIGNFGLETQFSFLVDERRKLEWEDEGFGFGDIFDGLNYGSINLLYQLPIGERWQHNVRFGVGGGESYHVEPEIRNDGGGPYTYYGESGSPLYFDLGYSLQYFLWKNLYFEAGVDLVLAHNTRTDHNHFIIRPGLGLGWQMGRWAEFAEVAESEAAGEDYSVPVEQNPKAEHLLSLGWAPLLPLSGMERRGWHPLTWYYNSVQGYRSEEFLRGFEPLGVNLNYAYIPYRWGKNKLGFGIEMSFLFHENWRVMEDWNQFFDLFQEFMFDIRYQRILAENWQLNGKFGIGMVNPYDYRFDEYDSEWELTSFPAMGIKFGLSAQYFFSGNFYVEPSVDLGIYGTGKDEWNGTDNKARFYLKPGISIGYQFRRNNETGLRLPGTGLPSRRGSEDRAGEEVSAE